MLRLALTAVVLTAFLISVEGQQRGSADKNSVTNKPAPKRSVEIENLISEARSLPPEFAVDALLRLAAANSIDKKWRQEILAEAFALTSDVKNDLRRRSKGGIPVDSRANYKSYGFDLRLDALSLRSRIIGQIISIDKNQAQRMLGQISPGLRFASLACSDQLIYDVEEFYRMLGNAALALHDEKKIQQGERVQFLLPFVEGMSSPAQVAPVSKMIVSLRPTTKELFVLSQAFAGALRQISSDDRSFTAALIKDRTATHLFEFVQLVRKENGAAGEVERALRSYLSKHLNGVRCEDNVKPITIELQRHIKEINLYFPNSAFTLDDLRPSRLEEGITTPEYFESREAGKLSLDFKELRGYDDDDPTTQEPKTSPAWQERMLKYLQQLEAWDGRSETSAIDYFHQKCILYFALAQIAPAGEAGDQVLSSYVNFLNQPAILKENPFEWMLHGKHLLGLLQEKKGTERSRLFDLLLYSKNPTLQLNAKLINANIR